jgi:probable HAF family extracellular repeat protein
MRRHLHLGSVSVVVLLSFTSSVAWSQTLTTIDVPNASRTFARGINDRSEVVGGFNDFRVHGFLRSRGQFTVIDVPGSTSTLAFGINNKSQIVGSYGVPGERNDQGVFVLPIYGFLLDRGHFTRIAVPNADATIAFGINDLGQIVGAYYDARGTHGFLWTNGQFITIEVPDAFGTEVRGINNLGNVVGLGRGAGSSARGFRFEAGGDFTWLDIPRAVFTIPQGVNGAGEIVGEQLLSAQYRGFRRAFGVFTTIDVPGATSAAWGINSRRQVVGQYTDQPSGSGTQSTHGFLLTPANEVEDVSGDPSPDGTKVPVAPVIVDRDLGVWMLGGDQEILRDGVQVAGGYGTQILWYQGDIYVLGDDSNWWRWTGSVWTPFGSIDPSS